MEFKKEAERDNSTIYSLKSFKTDTTYAEKFKNSIVRESNQMKAFDKIMFGASVTDAFISFMGGEMNLVLNRIYEIMVNSKTVVLFRYEDGNKRSNITFEVN